MVDGGHRERDGGTDVIHFKVRQFLDNPFEAQPCLKKIKNIADPDAHAANAWTAPHTAWG